MRSHAVTAVPDRQADLTLELAQLLVFVADVAIAIRMNSAYNARSLLEDRRGVADDVMWLSDTLHHLDRLGRALLGGDGDVILATCDALSNTYRRYETRPPDTSSCAPKKTFERYRGYFDLRTARMMFDAVAVKVTSTIDTESKSLTL